MATTTSYAASPEQVNAKDSDLIRATELEPEGYSLSVPAGATVNGIEIIWWGGFSATLAESENKFVWYVNNGSSNSALKQANEVEYPIYSDVGRLTIGGSSDLWGLSWTPTTANSIVTGFVTEIGTAYHDSFQVVISYTAADAGNGKVSITSGKFSLTSGKITI
tara:strand:+ start:804 stop:1295 length:492 start_codon:yes stop_codon:yes gene_type:complete